MNRIDEQFTINNKVIEFLKSKGYSNSSILQEVSVSDDIRSSDCSQILF
ncbi:hypothetical protein GCM10008915_71120 [Bifidobacterium pullorum subsp. gallinarum]